MTVATTAETIRKRPGMYIGDTWDGSGLAHMVWEVVGNSIDQHLLGRCSRVHVQLEESGFVTVEDDGPGIPIHEAHGMALAEQALTSFHNTPTLDGHAPHSHVGPYGLGLFVVCALSTSVELTSHRDGRRWAQRFAKGNALSRPSDEGASDRTGTRLTFLPDPTIFKGGALNATTVLERLSELSFLLPQLTLQFADRRHHTLHQPRGLAGHLEETARHAAIGSAFTFVETVDDVMIDVAARWSPYTSTTVQSFANTERTTSGGTHVRGLLAGLSEALKRAAPESWRRVSAKARARAIAQGLTAIICVRLDDPTYDSPTKSILSTPRVQNIVKAAVARRFAQFLPQEPPLLHHFQSGAR